MVKFYNLQVNSYKFISAFCNSSIVFITRINEVIFEEGNDKDV